MSTRRASCSSGRRRRTLGCCMPGRCVHCSVEHELRSTCGPVYTPSAMLRHKNGKQKSSQNAATLMIVSTRPPAGLGRHGVPAWQHQQGPRAVPGGRVGGPRQPGCCLRVAGAVFDKVAKICCYYIAI